MFDLKRVNIAYRNTPVLKEISLRVKAGEKTALIGPSGAGKSTLLKKLFELRRERAAFIHQEFGLVPQLSVFHNVYIGRLDQYGIGRNLLNLLKPQRGERAEIESILKDLGIDESMRRKVETLSGGQQQRVAVARALYRKSDVILADEPVASIDPFRASEVLKLLKKSAPTVILSLHSVHHALDFFDRIIGLRSGRIYFDLPRQEVSQDRLSELYG